jgi:hypothetical protein
MDPFKSNQATSQKNSQNSQQNSFARALAELEKNSSGQKPKNRLSPNNGANDIFNADQLKKSGQLPVGQNPDQAQPFQDQNMFQEMMKAEAEKKRRSLERHREINPIDLNEVYNARKERTKKEINQLRIELKKLAEEVGLLNKEITLAVTQDATDMGLSGTYHENFFEKLKQLIIMLRQRVHSARTWARQQSMKQAKKRRKYGLNFAGNEAKAVHDSFHHERSMSFGA